jgi:predicted dehydrogenase
MKFLIAGLGSIGRRHFRNLLALGEKDIVLLRSHRATLPDDELAGYPIGHLHEALKKHKPDAVIVANPTSLHLDVAIPAAEAGCAILLEKPVSNSLDRVDELQKAAQKGGSKILVGFQFRYHPTLNKAREMIQSNAIGKVLTVHAHWGEKSSAVASVGGLSSELRGSQGSWWWCHCHAHTSARLFAFHAGRYRIPVVVQWTYLFASTRC